MIDGDILPAPSQGGTGVTVSLDVLPRDALRAIISKLNERSQQATIAGKDRCILSLNHVSQLLEKLSQEFEGHRIISHNVSARLILDNNRRFDFTKWVEVLNFDRSIGERTKSLSVESVFDVFRGESLTPERYSIGLNIHNSDSNFRLIVPAGPDGMPDFDAAIQGSNVSITVKYQSYIMGKNLLSTSQGWIETLEKQVESRWINPRTSSRINSSISTVSFVAGLVACISLPVLVPKSASATQDLFYWALIAVAIVLVFGLLGEYIGSKVESKIDARRRPCAIKVTEGDERYDRELAQNNKNLLRSAASWLVVLAAELAVSSTMVWLFVRLTQ